MPGNILGTGNIKIGKSGCSDIVLNKGHMSILVATEIEQYLEIRNHSGVEL